MSKKDADPVDVRDVHFVGSFPSQSQCPKDERPAYAFIGRSNVGKSSLINLITGRRAIAKVSKTPGKTQLINYFLIDDTWYLVDLPGYGYAKVSKSLRTKWQKMIERFLLASPHLVCTFVLLDARLPLQQNDLDFINWLGSHRLPFVLVYTKTDKLKKTELEGNIEAIRTTLLEYWNELPQQFTTSSTKHIGREALLAFIHQVNNDLAQSYE